MREKICKGTEQIRKFTNGIGPSGWKEKHQKEGRKKKEPFFISAVVDRLPLPYYLYPICCGGKMEFKPSPLYGWPALLYKHRVYLSLRPLGTKYPFVSLNKAPESRGVPG